MYLFHSNAWMQCEVFHTDLCPQLKVCRLQKGMVIIMDVNGLTYTMSATVSDIKNEKTDTAAKTDSTQTKDNNTDQATATTPSILASPSLSSRTVISSCPTSYAMSVVIISSQP